MSKKKKTKKRKPLPDSSTMHGGNPPGHPESDTASVIQQLTRELQNQIYIVNALKKEHLQLKDGFLFLMTKIENTLPHIREELSKFYSTNHNLTGRIIINQYNIDEMETRKE